LRVLDQRVSLGEASAEQREPDLVDGQMPARRWQPELVHTPRGHRELVMSRGRPSQRDEELQTEQVTAEGLFQVSRPTGDSDQLLSERDELTGVVGSPDEHQPSVQRPREGRRVVEAPREIDLLPAEGRP